MAHKYASLDHIVLEVCLCNSVATTVLLILAWRFYVG